MSEHATNDGAPEQHFDSFEEHAFAWERRFIAASEEDRPHIHDQAVADLNERLGVIGQAIHFMGSIYMPVFNTEGKHLGFEPQVIEGPVKGKSVGVRLFTLKNTETDSSNCMFVHGVELPVTVEREEADTPDVEAEEKEDEDEGEGEWAMTTCNLILGDSWFITEDLVEGIFPTGLPTDSESEDTKDVMHIAERFVSDIKDHVFNDPTKWPQDRWDNTQESLIAAIQTQLNLQQIPLELQSHAAYAVSFGRQNAIIPVEFLRTEPQKVTVLGVESFERIAAILKISRATLRHSGLCLVVDTYDSLADTLDISDKHALLIPLAGNDFNYVPDRGAVNSEQDQE